jgi:hypothetical protein
MNTFGILLSPVRLCFIAYSALIWLLSQGVTEAELQSEVTLWLESGQAVATSQLSGRIEIPLGAQEVVISSGTNGINGIVVTSRRLLGVFKPCSNLEQERPGRE